MSGHLTGVQRDTPWRVLIAERRWRAVCLTCGWEHGPHRDRDVAAAYASLHRGYFRRRRWPVGLNWDAEHHAHTRAEARKRELAEMGQTTIEGLG